MSDARGEVATVSELNRRIAEAVAGADLGDVACRGEVVDAHETDAALYFTLTDGEAELRCVCWQSRYRSMDDVADGDEVVARGEVEFWAEGGELSLKPRELVAVGEGDRLAAVEKRRRELRARGWMDEERKRDLPDFPDRVGVVTSAGGDARHDVTDAVHERHPGIDVVLAHASVQGEAAPAELAAGIERLDGCCDVVVVGRGGGSDTDLAAFDTERVAAAIVACETPVVAAVGHREDRTIADEVADASAITPTAAGALVAPDLDAELERVGELRGRVEEAYRATVRERLDGYERRLDDAVARIERDHEHEREKREAVERARESVPRRYRVALALLALLVVGLAIAVVLLL